VHAADYFKISIWKTLPQSIYIQQCFYEYNMTDSDVKPNNPFKICTQNKTIEKALSKRLLSR
jgi:hypothetical protein